MVRDNGRYCGWVGPESRHDDKPKSAMNDMRLHRDLKQYVIGYMTKSLYTISVAGKMPEQMVDGLTDHSEVLTVLCPSF